MTEAVLTRLRDFSSKTDTFGGGEGAPGRPGSCSREEVPVGGRPGGQGSPYSLDIGSALAWLRWELMEMRSQDQVLIRQLIELHTGIQDLKQELSEEDQNQNHHHEDEYEDEDGGGDDDDGDDDDGDDEGEESSSWESCSETGSGGVYSGETALFPAFSPSLKMTPPTSLSAPPYWLSAPPYWLGGWTTANRVSGRRSSVP
ncbi:hypothetical protein NHX12_024010 [Muraenolepis orangiensis]|uniref:Uncharacterized protein n=1 Tax=Muraenolepis orangiensis TaxID=630683 RepID=A0A9Q0ISL9_9TELE|nr:hypothetical protein NHX12_024010 [Muraenolepis orangiensis]